MEQCKDLPGTGIELVALVFELAHKELARSPERVVAALRSTRVQKAVEKALLDEANRFLAAQRKGEEIAAMDAAKALGGALAQSRS